MTRPYVATYETGIAIPPTFECVCGRGCDNIDCHHNAFDEPYYKNPPGVRKLASRFLVTSFRASVFNRFWLPRCAHIAAQPTGDERVRRPKLEIIEGFLEETAILQGLDDVSASLRWSAKRIDRWSPDKSKKSLEEIIERHNEFIEKQEAYINLIDTIEIIPEEVVTSALLYSAPAVAAERLKQNPLQNSVAPLNWPRHQVLEIARSREGIDSGDTGQTEVNRVELQAA